MTILEDEGGLCVRSDWRQREKVIRPDLLESQARQFAQALIDAADHIAELEAQR